MKLFKADYICKTVYDINIEEIKNKGIKMVLLDIDNTIISWDSSEITCELRDWIEELKNQGIIVRILSNANKDRVEKISQELGVKGIGLALKPFWKNYKKSIKDERLNKNEVLMVGDQVFTDLLGAKIYGIKCVLVEPLSKKELRSTKFMRKLEKYVRD